MRMESPYYTFFIFSAMENSGFSNSLKLSVESYGIAFKKIKN